MVVSCCCSSQLARLHAQNQHRQPSVCGCDWNAGDSHYTEVTTTYKTTVTWDKPVIRKALVELDGAPFKYFEAHRKQWAVETCFKYPGAIQYYGPAEVCDLTTVTLALEQAK